MEKEINKKEKAIALFEIFLAVSLTITTAYLINESYKDQVINNTKISNSDITMARILAFVGKTIFGTKGIVSALDSGDLSKGAYTCLKTKTGSICQEFPASECNTNCESACIPAKRENTAECKLGTCYDKVEGTCTAGSPKDECEAGNSTWLDDPYENVAQCKKGCCFIGDQTTFVTQKQCSRKSSLLGIETQFKSNITTELECVLNSRSQVQGACVFDKDFEKTCKFTTKEDCGKLSGSFNEGYLCSAPELKTICEKQKTASCTLNRDEIYWFDSCGNIENIYEGSSDIQKAHSWNNGKILSKTESCDENGNRGTCGNCDYLSGSRCGLKTTTEKLQDSNINVVCRDLTCKDENGNVRQNGESWCRYQSSIGIDKAGKSGNGSILYRSIDTPGSRQFREVCIDGEVREEPCADYRNEICIQADTKTDSGKIFSSAACRLNRWQQCIDYNAKLKNPNNPNGITPEERNQKCNKNPDCFLKEVNLGKGFTFNICAPKYPEGFDLSNQDSGTGAQDICSLASQKCTEVWVKDMGGGWNCVANCDCHTTKFSTQMNDLCISLGDCGTKANYRGDLTYNSKVYESNNAKKLGKDVTLSGKGWFPPNYLNALTAYANYKNSPNKFVDGANLVDFYGSLGTEAFGNGRNSLAGNSLQGASTMVGMGGTVLAMAVPTIGGITTAHISAALTVTSVANPGLAAAAGALAGAAIGFSAVSMMIQFSGIGPAIGEEGSYALMAAGAAAGGIIGGAIAVSGIGVGAGMGATVGAGLGSIGVGAASAGAGAASGSGAVSGSAAASSMTAAGPFLAVAFWLIVAIVIFIVIEAILGAGEMKKVTYTFQCQPWQAPTGGTNCNKCGQDGFPCSQYSCQSLGQTCQFINEGTGNEACVNINPNDVTSPNIKPLNGVLSEGFSYNENENGVVIKSNDNDGCLKAYQPLTFGIQTDEPSYCKLEANHTSSFEEMGADFAGSNLYIINHTQPFIIPGLASLGGNIYDPESRQDYNLYVRCQDKSGNANEKEYVINFCVKPGDDLAEPTVVGRMPTNEYVSYNATQMNGSVIVSEPVECRYDKNDISYESMQNNMNCLSSYDSSLGGDYCSTQFNLTGDETHYYIRCLDQPWLTQSNDGTQPGKIKIKIGEYQNGTAVYNYTDAPMNEKRNAASHSYDFVIKRTTSKLNIDSLSPDNVTIKSGVEPTTVNVNVNTSGGIDGTSDCSYSISAPYFVFGGDQFVPPGVKEHNAVLQLFAGEHQLEVVCRDLAGNIAEKTTNFNLEIDTDAPMISRVYKSNDQLDVVTNENSECSFVTSIAKNYGLCGFDFENGTMMNGNELIHSIGFDLNQIYYIKCKDGYGNINSGCGITIKGADLTVHGQQTSGLGV